MAIALTDTDLYDLMVYAHEQGEHRYKPTDLGYPLNMPQQIGQGDNQAFQLRGGLTITIRNIQLQQPLALQKQYENAFSYCLANVALSYRRDNWRLGVNIDNLFNSDYTESVNGFRFRQVFPGPTLTVRASVSYTF